MNMIVNERYAQVCHARNVAILCSVTCYVAILIVLTLVITLLLAWRRFGLVFVCWINICLVHKSVDVVMCICMFAIEVRT